MRKTLIFIIVLIIMIGMSACEKIEVVPMENPEPELFNTFYEGDGYEILRRREIEEGKVYVSLGYGVEADEGYSCLTGASVIDNYRVLYDGEYYNIQTGSHLGLYTGNDLEEIGINITCSEEKDK